MWRLVGPGNRDESFLLRDKDMAFGYAAVGFVVGFVLDEDNVFKSQGLELLSHTNLDGSRLINTFSFLCARTVKQIEVAVLVGAPYNMKMKVILVFIHQSRVDLLTAQQYGSFSVYANHRRLRPHRYSAMRYALRTPFVGVAT